MRNRTPRAYEKRTQSHPQLPRCKRDDRDALALTFAEPVLARMHGAWADGAFRQPEGAYNRFAALN